MHESNVLCMSATNQVIACMTVLLGYMLTKHPVIFGRYKLCLFAYDSSDFVVVSKSLNDTIVNSSLYH